MEAADNSRELLDNVAMSEASPFIIQRVDPLASDLLPSHAGLVVDMASTEYLPNVTYTTEDLLGHDLTEEDRNLAAALVAVQLVQQQKQQQLSQDTNVIMTANAVSPLVAASLENGKDDLTEQHQFVIPAVDKPVLASIEASYMSAVDERHLHHSTLPSLKRYPEVSVQPHEHYTPEGVKEDFIQIKHEIDHLPDDSMQQRDSDCDAKIDVRTSKKSLPHKKRISRKLKKNCNVSRKGHKCNICDQIFSTFEELSNHTNCQNVNIVQPNAFACQICSAICKDQLGFFEHLKTHYEPSAISNHIRESPSLIKNEESKDSLLSSLLPPLNCGQCGKNFRRQKAFEAHMRDAHTNKIEDEFSEPEDLMEGIRSVVEANDRDSGDEQAENKGWYQTDDLRGNEINFQNIGQICHMCGQVFSTSEEVMQHLQECKSTMSENIEELPDDDKLSNKNRKKRRKGGHLACLHCDRIFSHRNSLMYHMQGHTGERPHQCEICGKSFFTSSALKVHMRLHSGDKPYKCEYCGRHFRQWGDLKYHCISIHSDEKQYQCEYCGKDFARKYSLIVHRRIHTGEKNYRCEFCGKSFRASSYLQNHRRIHTGEKPHPCNVCGKPFRVRSDMKRHLNTHSRRRNNRPTPVLNSTNAVIDVQDNVENTESMGPKELERPDSQTELDTEEQQVDSTVQYTRDPLETVREGTNTLFSNGPQLFICYPGELQVRSSLETQWIQTDN